MIDIPTALTPNETKALRSMAEGKKVLEIGSLLGYSTVNLASVAEHVVAIDPHEGYPEADPKPTLNKFLNNLKLAGVRHKVTVIVEDGLLATPYLRKGSFDMAFIDATGEYELTMALIHDVHLLLRSSGVLCVHDMDNKEWPGATVAVVTYAQAHGFKWERVDSLAVMRPTFSATLNRRSVVVLGTDPHSEDDSLEWVLTRKA